MSEVHITPRETEVIRWIADGKTSAEIGRLIGCATATVDRHKRNVLEKLEAPNSVAMVAKAIRGKIIE